MSSGSPFPKRIIAFTLILAAAIFLADRSIPLGVAVSIIYVTLALLGMWVAWKPFPFLAATLATVLTIAGYFVSPPGSEIWIDLTNRGASIFAVWVTTALALERRVAKARLEESEERYALAFRGANDGLWIWKIDEDDCHFSYRWKEIIGWGPDQVGSMASEWFDRVNPKDLAILKRQIAQHLDRQSDHLSCEHRLLHKDGTYRWVLARGQAVWDEKGQAVMVAGSLTDITERKRKERMFRYKVSRDSLTGLLNRRRFLERLEKEVRISKKLNRRLSFCVCDIDHFKLINDTYGHRTGDKVLARFGKLLQNLLGNQALPGRYGGDEFCVIFSGVSSVDAAVALDRLRIHLSKIEFTGEKGEKFFAQATFGVAEQIPEQLESKALIEAADKALYKAKNLGRNRVVYREMNGNVNPL